MCSSWCQKPTPSLGEKVGRGTRTGLIRTKSPAPLRTRARHVHDAKPAWDPETERGQNPCGRRAQWIIQPSSPACQRDAAPQIAVGTHSSKQQRLPELTMHEPPSLASESNLGAVSSRCWHGSVACACIQNVLHTVLHASVWLHHLG